MPLSENVSGTWKPLSLFENVSGSWLPIVLWENISGVWTLISGAFSVAAPDATGSGHSLSSSGLVSASSTAVPTNGLPTITYAWTYVSGDAVIAATGTSSITASFSKTIGAGPQSTTTASAVWKVTATDGASQVSSQNINVSLSYTNDSG